MLRVVPEESHIPITMLNETSTGTQRGGFPFPKHWERRVESIVRT